MKMEKVKLNFLSKEEGVHLILSGVGLMASCVACSMKRRARLIHLDLEWIIKAGRRRSELSNIKRHLTGAHASVGH